VCDVFGFPFFRFLIGQYANVYGDVISHVNITSVRVEDGGEYECSFENRAGKTAHAARLNIYGEQRSFTFSALFLCFQFS